MCSVASRYQLPVATLRILGFLLAPSPAEENASMATPEQKNVSDLGEQAIALAEQLGRIAGTIEGTAEAWLNRQSLTDQLTRVRDGAAEMLESLTTGAERGRSAATATVRNFTDDVRRTASKAVTAVGAGRQAGKGQRKSKKTVKRAAASGTRADAAHAPGKQHRKPAPTKRGVKKSDERIPKARTAETVRQRRKSYA
jgi:hypothetical protein